MIYNMCYLDRPKKLGVYLATLSVLKYLSLLLSRNYSQYSCAILIVIPIVICTIVNLLFVKNWYYCDNHRCCCGGVIIINIVLIGAPVNVAITVV